MKVLGVAGSLRRGSHNRTLLRAAGSLLPHEVQFTEYNGLKLLPPFDEDDESAPALAVAHWRDAIAQADAILFATPEYNSSIPGQLKNAVDWASRPAMRPSCETSRSRSSAQARAHTGLCGHKPSCVRSWPRPVPDSSIGNSPSVRPTMRLRMTRRSKTGTWSSSWTGYSSSCSTASSRGASRSHEAARRTRRTRLSPRFALRAAL